MFSKISKLKIAGFVLIAALIGGGAVGYSLFRSNVPLKLENEYLMVPTGTSAEELVNILHQNGFIKSTGNYEWWAEKMVFKTPRSGRFKIGPGWSSYRLIKFLQRGEQAPVRLVLNNERFAEHVAGKAARFIEADSLSMITLFRDSSYLDSIGYTPELFMTIFIPNSYELFWNTSPRGFVQRMIKEHDRFWTDARRSKAAKLGLSIEEVYTLASIVEWETNQMDEKPRIAGVYLNRLRTHEKLGADPTVQFALMQTDGGPMRRLYNRDYLFDHPYNTYLIPGLPPGPIGMASIGSIDAVLDAEQHDYFYFCRRPDDSDYHVFAETYEGHLVNARMYQKYLEELTSKGKL